MSRSLGPSLAREMVARLSQKHLAAVLGRVVPVITVDDNGRPHPMLCSYLELLAVDAHTVRLVIGGGSRSATNLEARGTATLLLVEPDLVAYVKVRTTGPPLREGDLARFDLVVEDVLVDSPAAWEAGLAITAGPAYGPVPDLASPSAQATLALLRAPRAG